MDWSTIIVALIAFAGTLTGTIAGNKLTLYRISELEKKVEKHNNIVERTFRLEDDVANMKTDIAEIKQQVYK